MALNISFTCNEIVDENGNAIDCSYQAFHTRTSTWNNIRESEYNQYSFNAGDGDFLTQTGELKQGDIVIINFWQSGNDRTGLKDRFSSFVLVHDGSTSTYVIDVQLKPKTTPNCGFSLTTYDGRINSEVHTINTANDEHQWTYNGLTHYHNRIIYNELIFDSVGIKTTRFDYDEGQGLVDNTSNIYENIGDYTVQQKVTNYYGTSKICQRNLRIRYNIPAGGIVLTYISPIHTTEDATVTATITDTDSRITNVAHKLVLRNRDTNSLLSTTIKDENTILDYEYQHTVALLQKHFFTQEISWNDGFENQTLNYYKEMVITNWFPDVAISKVDKSPLNKAFVQTSSDLDGDVVNWNWKIYFIPPFSEGEYVEVHSYNADNGNNWDVEFTVSGEYKTRITVTDDYGDSTFAELEYSISSNECKEVDTNIVENIKFIFPKQM